MYLDRAKERFLEFCQTVSKYHNPSSPYIPVPSSEGEIKAMEKTLNLSFPAAYQEFLLWMGKGAGSFMDSYVCVLRTLPRNKEDAIELMEGDACTDILPKDAIVFAWGNQGCYFSFIRASEGDNPPVHDYDEGKGITWNADPNLETFVIRYIDDFQKYILKLKNVVK